MIENMDTMTAADLRAARTDREKAYRDEMRAMAKEHDELAEAIPAAKEATDYTLEIVLRSHEGKKVARFASDDPVPASGVAGVLKSLSARVSSAVANPIARVRELQASRDKVAREMNRKADAHAKFIREIDNAISHAEERERQAQFKQQDVVKNPPAPRAPKSMSEKLESRLLTE